MENTIFDRIKEVADKDQKNVEQTALKLVEECGEVAEAVLSFSGAPACGYKGKTLDDIIEECCDVIIVAYTLAGSKYKIPRKVIEERLIQKLNKWEKKIEADIKNINAEGFTEQISLDQAINLPEFTRVYIHNSYVEPLSGVHIVRRNGDRVIFTEVYNESYYSSSYNPDLTFYVTPDVARALEVVGK